MMTSAYPQSFGSLTKWAGENDLPAAEARTRFAQFAVLCAITSVEPLRIGLVFKGGNALDFVWQSNRSTVDLDFSFDPTGQLLNLNPEALESLLDQGLRLVGNAMGISFAVNSVKQQPPGDERSFITYTARVGYALPDQKNLRIRMANGQISAQVIPVEISMNEPICASTNINIDDRYKALRVGTKEDIVAEKLRALLQQPIRNRQRRQDLLDIAVLLHANTELDRNQIAKFLVVKAGARSVPLSRAAFHDPEIAMRARQGYENLENTTRTAFISFDDAWAALIAFVDELPIPPRSRDDEPTRP